MPTGTPAGAQTLERGLAVLTELARHDAGLSTAQVAAAVGLHRTVAHRLLVSLVGTGFARRDAAGRHHVGPAVVRPRGRRAARRCATSPARSCRRWPTGSARRSA